MSKENPIHPRVVSIVPDDLPIRQIAIFLVIAFGLTWLPAIYFALEGITTTNRNFSTLKFNAVILATSFSPAVATLITRWVTGEQLTRDSLLLPFDLRSNWREYLLAALLPLFLAVLGAALYFAVFPSHLAAQPLETLTSRMSYLSGLGPISVLIVGILASLLGILPGSLMVFGEELGWRAYLLPKLSPLGLRTATLLTGLIWGVWHWPFIYLGVNYPNEPWLGMLAMVWLTTLYGTLLAWVTFRAGSVWPAAVGHTAFNTSARWGPMIADVTPNFALGPGTGGFIGSLGWLIVAGWLLIRTNVFTEPVTGGDHEELTDRHSDEQ